MNRRSIFKLLVGAVCAAAIEITGLAPALPKAAKYVVNPEWLSAAYEDVVVFSNALSVEMRQAVEDKGSAKLLLRFQRKEQDDPLSLRLSQSHPGVIADTNPTRYNFVNGEYQQTMVHSHS